MTLEQQTNEGMTLLKRERHEAFALLGEVVAENYAAGRRSYGASLKPELRRRTLEGFDERRLEFNSFRKFLEAGEEAGVVALHEPPKGPDLEATPPGKPSLAATIASEGAVIDGAPTPPPRKRIKPDLWKAFLDWDARWRRVYDKEEGLALRFPAEPARLERPESQAARRLVQDKPERFVEIEPISFDRQLEWLRDFAQTVSDPAARAALDRALDDERPMRAFSQALQGDAQLRHRWTATKLAHVEEAIRHWATTFDLELEVHEHAPDRPEAAGEGDGRSGRHIQPERPDEQLRRLRARLHVAIDRMPEAELLQLRLPVEYLVRR